MRTELVTSLKRQATSILADLHNHKEPILITEHGRPAAYLVDVEDFEHMAMRMALLAGIAKGQADFASGNIATQLAAKQRLHKWLK
ncbi:MAG: type II toxin-antitoxin system Phd/YefM family antitoxin [Gammaproteobacteria bacterium]|jgi:prevent-host-death family protein|nr:type II toxin-antitoxin system Phd/YefM family antitoxin [Gammaproteobacteria bacterium]